ncbi:MAG: SPFH/Band 7/PHB domain protein [Thermoleophilia bacterium]|nr:SPFH/Band 7/PHB domain protein [Thermoleophilia bacterium]
MDSSGSSGIGVGLIALIILAIVVIVIILRCVRVVSQAQVQVVERLGKYSKTLDPGLHILVPFLDSVKATIDMREQVVAFPPQPVITRDNVTISIDTVLYYTVTDPVRATYQVAQLIAAVEQLTITTLRNVTGSLTLDEALTSRDKINADLRIVLDEATEAWGIRVSRIEVKSIEPPASIKEAMEKQMRAERDKRAAILNAEGFKQSSILTAEGERQSQILRAEAEQQANVLRATGDKEAQVLRADGEAKAITIVFEAIHAGNPSQELLTYTYLKETLPKVADGQATKLILVPSDAQGVMGAVASLGGAYAEGAGLKTPPAN